MATKQISPRKKAPNGVTAKSAAATRATQKSAGSLPKERWTILLAIAADGQLANFAIESLKQLKNSVCQPVDSTDTAEVKVAAQFSIDAPAGQTIPRYIFEDCKKGDSLSNYIAGYLNAPDDMTERDALINFVRWAFQQQKLAADHYALILWGHGPELLMQPPPAPGNGSVNLYLTPSDLRIALEEVTPLLPNQEEKFELIAFDACSMSMFEVAYEIRNYAEYMVASQEEVPDLSFPYDTIVPMFRKHGAEATLELLLQGGVYKYIQAYQDYIDSDDTDMKPATLSALRLSECDDLKNALCRLSSALSDAKCESALPSLLLKAREYAGDFVSGLYVDLADFAAELISALDATASLDQSGKMKLSSSPNGSDSWKCPILDACGDILNALVEDTTLKNQNLLVLANCSADADANGVSLYMPYLSNDEWAGLNRPMVKGGDATRGGKDFSAVLNDVSPQQLLCERRALIATTENYYDALQLSRDTGWYTFIQEQWTPILVTMAAKDLDVLYSAKQAALNAFRKSTTTITPCEPKK
jgi:Clostripain family